MLRYLWPRVIDDLSSAVLIVTNGWPFIPQHLYPKSASASGNVERTPQLDLAPDDTALRGIDFPVILGGLTGTAATVSCSSNRSPSARDIESSSTAAPEAAASTGGGA